jgi:hypothetical protein
MRLTKNTRLDKKPYKANNGYAAYNPTTFDPNKQISLNEQEFGITPSSVQTLNTGVAPQGGQSALRLEGAKTTPDLSGQKIDFNKSSSGASAMSPKSFDYSGLATTGMAMGVGAIENQQASLAAVDKAPSLGGEMGKGALKGASMVAPIALNPAMLTATGGLSSIAVPIAAGAGFITNYFTGNKKIDEFNKDKAARKSLADQALVQRTNQASQYNQMYAANRGYSAQGTNMSSFYGKHGGKLMKCATGGKIYKEGGSLNPVASDTKLALGRTHEQGGIKMSPDAEIEGGETVVNKGDHTLVVSDNLVNPETGRTFAKDDLKLARLQSKYEKSTSPLSRNSLKVVQAKRDKLHNMQQEMNGDASDQQMAHNGGKMRPINILTKPVKTSPRPATHFAKDGMKLYGKGGKDYRNIPMGIFGETPSSPAKDKTEDFVTRKANFGYTKGDAPQWTTTEKGGKMHKSPEGDYHITAEGKKLFRPVGSKTWQDRAVFPEKIEPKEIKTPSALKNDPFPVNAKVPEKEITTSKPELNVRRVGEAVLPGLQRAGKLASYAAPGLAQYYANKADIARQQGMKIPDAPQQGFVNLAKQNMEADRAAIRKQQADYNAGVTGSLADSQTAQLLKANMASKAGDALVKINQDQRNANIETANRQTQVNLGIDAANKEGKYKQAYSQLEKDVDLSRRKAGNVSELSANLRDVQNTNRQERYSDMDAAIKVAGLDERGVKYLDSIGANPRTFWRGYKKGGKLTKLR